MNRWLALLFLVCCFTLATILDPVFHRIRIRREATPSVLVALLGDSRRMFANHFFAEADAYFHSGFYPTIFDSATPEDRGHLTEAHEEHEKEGEHHEGTFLGKPTDWIDRFGRHFYPTIHTHLSNGQEREILPWLKLSAEMDPTRIETYVTASYWLRTTLHKPKEAEEFLREGLRANPDSYEIFLELGRVYFYNKKDTRVARNLYGLALQKWRQEDAAGHKPDEHVYEEILGELVRADRQANDPKQELADLEELIKVSQNKDNLRRTIEEVKAQLARQGGQPEERK
jgi:tetratricopeptide (TPR) repeat protein